MDKPLVSILSTHSLILYKFQFPVSLSTEFGLTWPRSFIERYNSEHTSGHAPSSPNISLHNHSFHHPPPPPISPKKLLLPNTLHPTSPAGQDSPVSSPHFRYSNRASPPGR